jgi:DnaK suppressor protein
MEKAMTTNVTSITTPDIKRSKAALESKLSELLTGTPERGELLIETQADPLDQVKSSTDRDMAVQQLNRHAQLIQEVRFALARLGDGTYGTCEHCEEPIPRRRLEAMPWARLCVPCQTKVEASANHDDVDFEHAA